MIYIVIFLVLFIGWSYIKARSRLNHANKMQALRTLAAMERSGSATISPDSYPSWISNMKRVEEFVGMVMVHTSMEGVPERFFIEAMSNPNDRAKLMLLAGTMEGLGSSFEEQAMASSDLVIAAWNKPHNIAHG